MREDPFGRERGPRRPSPWAGQGEGCQRAHPQLLPGPPASEPPEQTLKSLLPLQDLRVPTPSPCSPSSRQGPGAQRHWKPHPPESPMEDVAKPGFEPLAWLGACILGHLATRFLLWGGRGWWAGHSPLAGCCLLSPKRLPHLWIKHFEGPWRASRPPASFTEDTSPGRVGGAGRQPGLWASQPRPL